jgi:uncharacterized delta-60 repeat protein
VARLNPNGSLDTTFDGDGIVTTDVEGLDSISHVSTQLDGKIIGAGGAANNAKSIVVRYATNGALDNTFSSDGIAVNDFAATTEFSRGMIYDPTNNRITTLATDSTGNTMLFVRYASSGALDSSFNGDGILPIPESQTGIASSLIRQADGKMIATAWRNSGQLGLAVVRLNSSGSFDTSFGNDGVRLLEARTSGELRVALSGDKLIAVGDIGIPTDLVTYRLSLSITSTQSSDFDGDGFSDSVVFRPSAGQWFILRSTDNTIFQGPFGQAGDIPIDGDFDGDGRNDFAIYRPSVGQWWFLKSSDGTSFGTTFGSPTDQPAPGDYDKDGRTDMAIFRPSTGDWFVVRRSSNFSSFYGFRFGQNGDIPLTKQGL